MHLHPGKGDVKCVNDFMFPTLYTNTELKNLSSAVRIFNDFLNKLEGKTTFRLD